MTTEASAHPADTLGLKLAAVARDIKLSHSVFAMPFALLAAFLSAGSVGRLPGLDEFFLIVLCMFLARTVAMTANRLADARLDVSNPRTAGRAIPSGQLDHRFMLTIAGLCAAGFIAAAGGFWLLRGNAWPAVLSPLVLAYLVGYSYTKRFTWFCHLYLGGALALSPVAAAIAIDPGYLDQPEPWLLAGMVACWVGGFDVIYALQDIGHDRSLGLYSMPAKLGAGPALWVSRLLHLSAAACLMLLWRTSTPLGPWFLGATVLTSALLALEHALVLKSKTHRIHTAFLTVNGLISLVLGAAGVLEVVLAVRGTVSTL